MNKRIVSLTNLGLLLISGLGVAAQANAQAFPMKPGLWEITVLNETPGVDARRSNTSQTCYSAELLKSTQQALPRQYDFGSKCTIKDYKFAGDTASWSLSCTTKAGTLSGPGTVTYKAAEFSGAAQLVAKEGGKSKKVNQTITAKRLSDCK